MPYPSNTPIAGLLAVLAVVNTSCTTDFDRFNIGDAPPDASIGDGNGNGTGGNTDAIPGDGDGSGGTSGDGDASGGQLAGDGDVDFVCERDAAGDCIDCVRAADCGGRACRQGLCVGCEADSDCDGVCIDSLCRDCRIDNDCSTTEQCVDARCVPDRKPSGTWLSSGGGTTESSSYTLRISVGAPQPVGTVGSTSIRMSIGAGAGRPR